MADVAKIIERIRANGANVIVDDGKLSVVNGTKLPGGALDYIKKHSKEIAEFIGQENRRPVGIPHDAGLTQAGIDHLTRLLFSSTPEDTDPADWTWFVSKAAKIMGATSGDSA